ncbi:MAG: winged helix-turn-helix domain-containing protein [Chloroflexota bacterium]|nr:winged helix-turn-helix domain-containing protein [Chloroflexota bacterium]
MRSSHSVLVIGASSFERDACETLLRRNRFRTTAIEPYAKDPHSRPSVSPDTCVAVCDNMHTATHEVRLYRELWPAIPLLVIDASPGSHLVAPLLEAGADDVLSPARMAVQLVPRLKALARRQALGETARAHVPLRAGALKIDLGAHKVWAGEREVALSPTEFRILQKLCMHVGRVVPHREILIAVWGEFRPEMAEALRVYIRHIRRKVQEAGQAVTIVTRPGIGYMLAVPS